MACLSDNLLLSLSAAIGFLFSFVALGGVGVLFAVFFLHVSVAISAGRLAVVLCRLHVVLVRSGSMRFRLLRYSLILFHLLLSFAFGCLNERVGRFGGRSETESTSCCWLASSS